MKKLEKEAVLKERMILVGAVSFFIFILPYILHLAINGIQPAMNEDVGGIEQTIRVDVDGRTVSICLESYLVGALARSTEPEYMDETLKAVAVILRSNAVCAITEERPVARESFYTDAQLRILWGVEYENNIQRYQDAVKTTEGIVIFYGGEIVEVPFHKISAGETRDGEILAPYLPYVKSVSSAEDMYANGYYVTMKIEGEILGEDFTILSQDRLGYALAVKVKGKELSGEEFCRKYGLPSACFEYDKKEEDYVFYVRGKGHGFGLSIYGADALAGKGRSFGEILQYYYPGIEIRKENREEIHA